MTFLRLLIIFALTLSNSYATKGANNFYRNFWLPTYHGLRLNYCAGDSTTCGLPVATVYCKMMGYHRADQQLIDHNVGLTNIISPAATCKGWRCDGFKTIRCVANFNPKPAKAYHYRYRKFVYPRFEFYRVAWCYDGKKGCGERAAYSFCRRMGYLKTSQFAMEGKIAATKAIGNQKLCFGKQCKAFKYINCYR